MNKKIIIIIPAIILLGVGGFFGFKSYKGKSNSAYASMTEIPVSRDTINVQILSTGIIQPENKVEIKPPIAGRVEKVLVSEGVKVRKGQILAWMSSTERAALLDAATSRGAKELKEWEEMYRATPILAPINGMIIQKNVESGQTFTTQDPILVMSDRLTVKAQVDETDIAQIKLKQKAKISLDAYPKQDIEATVDQIAFDSKTVNNVTTYIVDVLPENPPVYMRSGMTANVVFHITHKDNVMVVPAESIKNSEGKNFVLVANLEDKNSPKLTAVEVGISDGKKTEIISGLADNDKILVQEFKLQEGKTGGGSPFSPMGGPRRPGGGGGGGHGH
jgi:macrolide-specific efflux system membrane fusion protein